MAAMKKFLTCVLAITFACSVLFYQENKAFSLERYVTNVAEGFSDVPSLFELTDYWAEDYYTYDASDMPKWIDWYTLENTATNGTVYTYKGSYPLAYDENWEISDKYRYTWEFVYNDDGTWNYNEISDDGSWPVITEHGKKIYYTGADPELEYGFFGDIVGFFERLIDSVTLIVDVVKGVATNIDVLLPWNSYVEVT